MKYGCIGEHLSHRFSKEIHNLLCDYEYEIKEIPRDELDEFIETFELYGGEYGFHTINQIAEIEIKDKLI